MRAKLRVFKSTSTAPGAAPIPLQVVCGNLSVLCQVKRVESEKVALRSTGKAGARRMDSEVFPRLHRPPHALPASQPRLRPRTLVMMVHKTNLHRERTSRSTGATAAGARCARARAATARCTARAAAAPSSRRSRTATATPATTTPPFSLRRSCLRRAGTERVQARPRAATTARPPPAPLSRTGPQLAVPREEPAAETHRFRWHRRHRSSAQWCRASSALTAAKVRGDNERARAPPRPHCALTRPPRQRCGVHAQGARLPECVPAPRAC